MNIIFIRQTTILFSGLFILVGMACNALFYWDFADTLLPKIIYLSLGLGFDGFKVLLLPMAYIFFTFLNRPFMASISVIVWGCLTCISLIAAYGFFTTVQDRAEREALIESSRYQMLNQSIANASQELERNNQYASVDINATELEIQALREAILHKRSHPYYNEQNPINKSRLQSEIDSLESQLKPLESQLKGARLYQAASEQRVVHLRQIGELDSSQASEETLNPMFVAMGKQLQIGGDEVKRMVLTFTAFITELLGTFAALVSVMLYHNEGHRNNSTMRPNHMYGYSPQFGNSHLSATTAYSVPIGENPRMSLKTRSGTVPNGTVTGNGTMHRGTGTDADSIHSERYNEFKNALLTDEGIITEIAQNGNKVPLDFIVDVCGCSRRDASKYAKSLVSEGILLQNSSNRYMLNTA